MTDKIMGLLLISLLALGGSIRTVYQRTRNISTGSWDSALTETRKSKSLLDCATKCQSKEESESLCNAFRYVDTDQYCYLSKVDLFNTINSLNRFSVDLPGGP